jgi:hypothetical protein
MKISLKHNNIWASIKTNGCPKMIGINIIWSSIQKLVDFTLNTKYTKNPHENIFKTQHLGIHKNKWMPK